MKVNDPNVTGASAGQVGATGLERNLQTGRGRRDGSAQESSLADSPDHVALSGMSAQLRALSMDSPEQVARLEILSAEVTSGRYRPDTESVSRNLIEEALRQD